MKTFVIFSLLLAISNVGFSQCGKHITLTSTKTEHIGSNGNVLSTEDETAVVDINKTDLSITINNNPPIKGIIKSDSCLWKVPYKDGKTVIKATLKDDQGNPSDATLTIDGQNGNITLFFEVAGVPDDNIRVTVTKFEEKN